MRYCLHVLLLSFLIAPLAQANLVFTSPPRETPEKGAELYQPIASYLSKALGQPVEYRHPGSWPQYTQDMRDDKYDIILDGPHFAAWRVKHLGHQAAVKLPGYLEFIVVTHQSQKKIIRIQHLGSKKVCGMPSPNMGTVSYLHNFLDATVPPTIVEIKGSFQTLYQAFRDGKCDALLMRSAIWKRMPKQDQADLKVVFTTEKSPNQVITVSKRVKDVDALARAMTSPAGLQAGDGFLNRFSKTNKKFVITSTKEYMGFEKYLEGVVWGW